MAIWRLPFKLLLTVLQILTEWALSLAYGKAIARHAYWLGYSAKIATINSVGREEYLHLAKLAYLIVTPAKPNGPEPSASKGLH